MAAFLKNALNDVLDNYIKKFCLFDEKRSGGGWFLTIGFMDLDKKHSLDRRFEKLEEVRFYLINEIISESEEIKKELLTTENK